MPTISLPPRSEPTTVTSAYAVLPMNATSNTPPLPKASKSEGGRPLANVVTTPDFGSTRNIRPVWVSGPYNAPSGPTVLPNPPSMPDTNSVGVAALALRASSAPSAVGPWSVGAVAWSHPPINRQAQIEMNTLGIESRSMV